MVQMYQKLPSEIMKISDEYVAYCFDEAIAEFIIRIEKGEKPKFKIEKDKRNKSYNPGLKLLLG